MADKVHLRDYQKSILERLERVQGADQATFSGYLGVEIGGRSVLVNLQEIRETLPMVEVQSVPLVKPWFLGVSNVRGVLYAINDLAHFLDGVYTAMTPTTRMLLIDDSVAPNAAFLADRLLGLRNLDLMKKRRDETRDTICLKPETYEDSDNRIWQVLDCNRLVRSKEFTTPYAS
jgi:twitching motility protein PilI